MPQRIRTRVHRATTRYAVAVALAAAFLAGCSDAPRPSPVKAQSAPPSPTVSSSPAAPGDRPPTMPTAARGTEHNSAVPFTRFYVQVLNYAARSLDSSLITRFSTRACRACLAIANSVDRVRRRGAHFVGGEWTVRAPQLLPQWRVGLAQVRTVVTYPKQLVFESKTTRPLHFRAGKTVYKFDLLASKHGWLVTGIT